MNEVHQTEEPINQSVLVRKQDPVQ